MLPLEHHTLLYTDPIIYTKSYKNLIVWHNGMRMRYHGKKHMSYEFWSHLLKNDATLNACFIFVETIKLYVAKS